MRSRAASQWRATPIDPSTRIGGPAAPTAATTRATPRPGKGIAGLWGAQGASDGRPGALPYPPTVAGTAMAAGRRTEARPRVDEARVDQARGGVIGGGITGGRGGHHP